MIDNMEGQITFADLGLLSTKMSPEPFPVTPEKTSRQSSRKSLGSQTQKLPMFLCLKRGSGHTADVSWEKANPGSLFPWHGGSMTPNTGAFLRGENVCVCVQTSTDSLLGKYSLVLNCGEKPKEPMPTKLSDILEKNVDSRYALSPKACQGILNRAKRRGKELPEALRLALERQASALTDGMSRASTSNQPMESQKPCTQESADTQAENHTLCQMQSVSKNEQENRGAERES